MRQEIFKLFSDCIPVKGFTRSIIYDLTRKTYYLITNELYDFIRYSEGSTLEEIRNSNLIDSKTLDIYLEFLTQRDLIAWIDIADKDQFPAIDLTWESPYELTSIIIEIDENPYDWTTVSQTFFKDTNTPYVALNFLSLSSIEAIRKILDALQAHPIRGVYLYIPFHKEFTKEVIIELSSNYEKIVHIEVYNSPIPENYQLKQATVATTKKDQIVYGEASERNFHCNISNITEALNYNLFYNRKLILSEKANKNNPAVVDYSNIQRSLENSQLKELWEIKKDDVLVCSDCEYRYMCPDGRIPVKNKRGIWYFNNECHYNPYICKWAHEQNYMTLEDCGVTCSDEIFYINTEQLKNMLTKIYNLE